MVGGLTRSPAYSAGERTSITESVQDLFSEYAVRFVVPPDLRVSAGCRTGRVEGGVPGLADPGVASAVEQSDVGVSEEGEHPQRVRGSGIGAVAVEHDGVVALDSSGPHQLGEPGAVDIVTGDRIIEVGTPVQFVRPGNVTYVIEVHIHVAFEDLQTGRADIRRQPLGGHQPVRIRIGGESGMWIRCNGHVQGPSHVWVVDGAGSDRILHGMCDVK